MAMIAMTTNTSINVNPRPGLGLTGDAPLVGKRILAPAQRQAKEETGNLF
jgi:hypothetical protein